MSHFINNGLNKLLILGKTGTGKSTLCNVLSGLSPDASEFAVSADPASCTQSTKMGNYSFLGDTSRRFTLIDTIGFDDPSKNHDAEIIAELVTKLKNNCDYVNLILIAQNGTNPRLDGALLAMMRIFEGMFTKKIWQHIGIVFTHMPMDRRSKERRGEDHDTFATKYIRSVKATFNLTGNEEIPYFFIDSKRYENDRDEVEMFSSNCQQLWTMLASKPQLSTDEVTRVQTENEKLNEKIRQEQEEKEKANREAGEALELARQEEALRRQAEHAAKDHEEKANKEKARRQEADRQVDQNRMLAERERQNAAFERENRERAERNAAEEKENTERERQKADEAERRRREAEDRRANEPGGLFTAVGKVLDVVITAPTRIFK